MPRDRKGHQKQMKWDAQKKIKVKPFIFVYEAVKCKGKNLEASQLTPAFIEWKTTNE